MDQSCVSLLSGRVGGISLKAGHRTHSGHTVPFAPTAGTQYLFAPTAFPTEASEKLPKDRKPSFCIRSEKEKHGI